MADAAALVVFLTSLSEDDRRRRFDIIANWWQNFISLLLASVPTTVMEKGIQIVLKLFQFTQVTSLTRLEQLLPGSGRLHTLAQVREDILFACSRFPASPKCRFW